MAGKAEIIFVSVSMGPMWPGKQNDVESTGKEFGSTECEELRMAKSRAKNLARAYSMQK